MLAGGRTGPHLPPASFGWACVAALVVGYDTWAAAVGGDTLSAQFRDAASRHPVAVGAATAYLVLHLWGAWPRRADPLGLFCRTVTHVTR